MRSGWEAAKVVAFAPVRAGDVTLHRTSLGDPDITNPAAAPALMAWLLPRLQHAEYVRHVTLSNTARAVASTTGESSTGLVVHS